MEEILEQIKNVEFINPILKLGKKVMIVEGIDDMNFYSLLQSDVNFYTPNNFSQALGISKCDNCQNPNIDCFKNTPTTNANVGYNGVRSLVKMYEDKEVYGILDRDYGKVNICLKCSKNIYLTKGFALENHLFMSETNLVKDFITYCEKQFIDSYSYTLNDDVQHMPALNEELMFDYQRYNKSHLNFDKCYVTGLVRNLNDSYSRKDARNILINWSLKTGRICTNISNDICGKLPNAESTKITKALINNADYLFPNMSVYNFIMKEKK